MSTDAFIQQSCTHCGDCARACPEGLNPEALFFALVRDDFTAARAARLDVCSECNRCTEVCHSRIPLLDWLRWGKSEMLELARADDARRRFLARNARLTRERAERAARRREMPSPVALPVQTISRSEVLAAIARGRARKARAKYATTFEAAVVKSQAKEGRSGACDAKTVSFAELLDGAAIRDDRTQ